MSANTSRKVVAIFNPDGTENNYELMSSRLPRFLEKYGPDKGYRVVISTTEYLGLRPALLELCKTAIESGKTPEEAGLPALGTSFVFKAVLFDQNGNEVANDFTLQKIVEYKDFERGATAARQRLMAAVGFGGQVFDDDEHATVAEMGGTVEAKQDAKPTGQRQRRKGKQAPAQEQVQEQAQEQAQEQVQEQPAEIVHEGIPVIEGVPEGIVRQIEHQAKMKGVPVPAYSNLVEAKQALKSLFDTKKE